MNEIKLRAGTFRHLPNGVIVGLPTNVDMNVEDAKEFIELFWRLEPKGGFRLMLDQRGVKRRVNAEAREHLKREVERGLDRLAIVTGNTISRFFASGILAGMGMGNRARAFDSEEAALSWLSEGRASAFGK
jgi:hypothetical protein